MWPSNTGDTTRGGSNHRDGPARWRERQLLRAGFEAELATALATDPAMDLHELIELVERGCPPKLAARILAPLEGE